MTAMCLGPGGLEPLRLAAALIGLPLLWLPLLVLMGGVVAFAASRGSSVLRSELPIAAAIVVGSFAFIFLCRLLSCVSGGVYGMWAIAGAFILVALLWPLLKGPKVIRWASVPASVVASVWVVLVTFTALSGI